MSDAASLLVDTLAQRCAEETERYIRHQASDQQFCFELLRRAFAQGVPEAFTYVYRVYERPVLGWVYKHSRFAQTGEDADFFASKALHTCYMALRGAKFERFPSLAHVLSYLKMCVHTSIMQYLRDQQPHESVSIEHVPEQSINPGLDANIDAAEVWQQMCALLPDARDRLLARCTFVLDLKPRQIVNAYPTHWRDEREVSVALFRIRRVLRNNGELRRRAGLL